jgi:MFS family permease
VGLGLLLYPLIYALVLNLAGAQLPAEQEGTAEIAGVAVGLFVLGFALGSWWCLVAPLLWSIVALAVGLEAPLENAEASDRKLLILLVLLAGLIPLVLGVATRRLVRRFPRRTRPAEPEHLR